MDKENVCVCVHAGILFSLLKKEGNPSFCDSVNEPEGTYAK